MITNLFTHMALSLSLGLMCCIHCWFNTPYLFIPGMTVHNGCNISQIFTFFKINAMIHLLFTTYLFSGRSQTRIRVEGWGFVYSLEDCLIKFQLICLVSFFLTSFRWLGSLLLLLLLLFWLYYHYHHYYRYYYYYYYYYCYYYCYCGCWYYHY